MANLKSYLVGVFTNEQKLLEAIHKSRKAGFVIQDAYTPYAVHGLDQALGQKSSRLPVVTFVVGTLAATMAMGFQLWSSGINWNIDVGGKPFNSALAFLPVTFELLVLIGGLTTAAAFFWLGRLYPSKSPVLVAPGVTNDRFAIIFARREDSFDASRIQRILKECGAETIMEQML